MADGMAADSPGSAAPIDPSRETALRWFDELQDPIRRYLIRIGVPAQQADDALQETFLRLYRQHRKTGDISNVRAWTFQVARNYIRDERRTGYRRRAMPLDEARLTDSGAGPEAAILSEERERRVRRAIEQLPPRERECIILRSSGLKYREIAEVMEISIATVSGLALRATARLAEEVL